MDPLATRQELADWMQVDEADLPASADLALRVATAAVVAEAPWVETLDPQSDIAIGVCLQAAQRVVSNPEQATSLRNGERAIDVPVGFALLPEEVEQLALTDPARTEATHRAATGRWPAPSRLDW